MAKPEQSFWKNKRVLVTGHTGFKGAWLCEWLLQANAEVTGYSLAPTALPNLFETLNMKNRMKSVIGDIRDLANFKKSVQEAKPDVILHLAAQALVRKSYVDPIETYSTNVMGTVHCLEIIRQVPSVQAAVIVTSDKCYDNQERENGFVETDAMGGFDPYSNSKGCAELVSSSYRNSFFQKEKKAVASARAGNVIGGGDWSEDRLIPDLIRGFQNNQPVMIRNPKAIRPWQHVLDPVTGYLLLAERLLGKNGDQYASGWNFGPRETEAATVDQVVTKLCTLWGPSAQWQQDSAAHPHEAKLLRLNCEKASSKLDWHPTWDLSRSLQETVNWYKTDHQSPAEIAALTRHQIKDFNTEIR